MPGPMSIPNGNPDTIIKLGEKEYVKLCDLTGEQRARALAQGKLNTGKTRKKRMNSSGGEPFMPR